MKNVLIAGGSGTIGTRLCSLLLQKGFSVTVLSRKTNIEDIPSLKALRESYGSLSLAHWNLNGQHIDADAIQKANYIINLTGAGVADKRWTAARKKEILESRTHAAALLIKGLREHPHQVEALVNASATGWYGPDKDAEQQQPFTETDAPAGDFLGQTCQAWEQSIQPATDLVQRLVILRTGIVLSRHGGAFTEFKKPVDLRVAGIIGDGKQIISWIHEDDICGLYLYALEQQGMNGVYNAVAPRPVSNGELVLQMARSKWRKGFIKMHVPAFALKMALGDMAEEVLKSTTASAQKVLTAGFEFKFDEIGGAVHDLVR